MRLIKAFMATLLIAAPAQAQRFPQFEAPSAEAAQTQIVAAIKRQGRWDVWESVTTGRTPELRHRQSGARCRFWDTKVFINARADHFHPSRPVGPGESVWCSTWIDLAEGTVSFETGIVAAPYALDGDAYRFFDGEGTPARVTPAYLSWRSTYWHGVRIGPMIHEPVRMIRGPGGQSLAVYGVRALIHGGITRSLSVMTGGWVVTQRLMAPEARDAEALQLALGQLEYMVATLDRPHPAANEQSAQLDAVLRAEAVEPEGAMGDIVLVARNAFRNSCVAPRYQGKPYAPDRGWREWRQVDAPAGLPNVRRAGPYKAWLVQEGPTGTIYVHYDAAMTGDCAVSVYGPDGPKAARAMAFLLTHGDEARFARGAYASDKDGQYNLRLEGLGWGAEGSIFASNKPTEGRPALFIGLRGATLPR